MRLVVQRVKKAQVKTVKDNKITGKITNGLLVLFGVGKDDEEKQADILAEKLIKLRIMQDKKDKMNLSILDCGSSILVVSQFNLYADTSKGNRPSFIQAANPDRAKSIYNYFINILKQKGVNVQTGSFGEYMQIEAVLDGPVTILYNGD